MKKLHMPKICITISNPCLLNGEFREKVRGISSLLLIFATRYSYRNLVITCCFIQNCVLLVANSLSYLLENCSLIAGV